MGLKHLGWYHYDIAGLIKKILVSVRVTHGKLPLSAGTRKVLDIVSTEGN